MAATSRCSCSPTSSRRLRIGGVFIAGLPRPASQLAPGRSRRSSRRPAIFSVLVLAYPTTISARGTAPRRRPRRSRSRRSSCRRSSGHSSRPAPPGTAASFGCRARTGRVRAEVEREEDGRRSNARRHDGQGKRQRPTRHGVAKDPGARRGSRIRPGATENIVAVGISRVRVRHTGRPVTPTDSPGSSERTPRLVPPWLTNLEAFGWRLLVIGGLAVVLAWISLVLVAETASLVLSAVIAAAAAPLVISLRARGWSRVRAALGAWAVVGAIFAAALVLDRHRVRPIHRRARRRASARPRCRFGRAPGC